MKKNILTIFSLCFVVNVNAQFKQQEFIIGAFVYPDIEYTDYNTSVARLQQVADANFNLLVYPRQTHDGHYTAGYMFDEDYNDKAIMIAADIGLKVLINDRRHMPRLWWNKTGYSNTFNSSTANTMVNHYKGLSDESSIYGYMLKDEPSPSTINSTHLPYLRSYIEFIKNNHSSKLGYINLVPYYDGYGFNGSKSNYEDYLDEYINEGTDDQNPDVVGFDYYMRNAYVSDTVAGPPTWDRTYSPPIASDYFYNLRIVREKVGSRAFWAYPEVADLFRGFQTDESYIRFGVYAPLAYGAKGLVYYTFETRTAGEGPDNTALSKGGVVTSKYAQVSEINSYLENVIGDVIINSIHLGAYHKSDFKNASNSVIETIPNNEKISSSPFVLDVSNDKTMIGQFYNIEEEAFYIFVVNKGYNDNFSTISTTVSLPGNLTNKVLTTSTTGSPNWNFNSVSTSYSNDVTTFTVSNLLPGEGRMYKVVDTGLAVWDRYVFLENSVTIDAGTKLKIEPNTIVYVADGKTINVYGDLEADGVTFTAMNNNWGGIIFQSSSDGYIKNSTIENVNTYGGAAIKVYSNTNGILLNGNTIQNLTGATSGIYVSNSSPMYIWDNVIENTTYYGIYVYNSNAYIYQNFIKNFVNAGVYSTSYSSVVFSDVSYPGFEGENTIVGGKYGIQSGYQASINAGNSSTFANQNRIANQSGTSWAHIYRSGTGTSIYAQYNYWKPHSGSGGVYPTVGGSGTLYYYPWLTTDPDAGVGFKATTPMISGDRNFEEPTHEELLLNEAVINIYKGNSKTASNQLLSLIKTAKSDKVAGQAIIEFGNLIEFSNINELLSTFESLEINTINEVFGISYLSTLAKIYYRRGEYVKALNITERIIEGFPNSEHSYQAAILSSYISYDVGDKEGANEYLALAIDYSVKQKSEADDNLLLGLQLYMDSQVVDGSIFRNRLDSSEIPTKVQLANYPNPFNPTTNIVYNIPKQSMVSLKVFDLLGREIAEIVNEVRPAGEYSTMFDASELSSGVYIYRLQLGDQVFTKRMTLIK